MANSCYKASYDKRLCIIHYCGQFWPVIPHTKLYDPRPETRVTPIPTVAQRDTAAVAQTTSAAASRCGQPPSSCAPPFFSVYELLIPCAHNLVPRLSRAYGKRAPIQNPRVVCNDLDVCVGIVAIRAMFLVAHCCSGRIIHVEQPFSVGRLCSSFRPTYSVQLPYPEPVA